ncbi:SIR2 family protein [Helcococcus kunzii]|uniref:SIR2 family protein n=1 Tax=Helcococcus kunzii TaxID=40091 RepID=UPI0038AD5F9A
MIINEIEYPNRLVEAIINNKLVVFAGAGVSMGKPTNLPSFKALSEQISQLTAEPKRKNEPDEQYLGRVKNLGHDVHQNVCKNLNESNLQPNEYHDILIGLFNEGNIRIVTTNYDLMFEKDLEQKGRETKVYSYPALPYGNEFKGIIHLHGEVNDPSNIVLTDSDFGKSYMYYGNVTSFLRALFESEYVVLFVGYSYSDIVMKYFTRALPDLSGEKRYIFANEEQVEDYKSLGLTPIIYNKDDYDQLYNSLAILSNLVIRDDYKWNLRIVDIAGEIPNKLNDEFNYEVKVIFNNIHYTNRFFSLIKDKKWAQYLFDMGYFDDVFTNQVVNDFGYQKIKWLSNNIIINELELFIKFCYEKDFVLNKILQNEIARSICDLKDEFDKTKILMNLINFKYINYIYLKDLIRICYEYSPELDFIASKIISTSLEFDLKKDSFISQDRLKIEFKYNNYEIDTLWKEYSLFDNKYYINILNDISNQIYYLERFAEIGISADSFIFTSFYEDEKDYIDEQDTFMVIFANLLLGLEVDHKDYWFKKYISSKIPILVRSSIFVLCQISCMSNYEKLKVLSDENIKILDIEFKEELFMLYKDIFPKLTDNDKKLFLEKLMNEEKLCERFTDESYFYQKYNLLVWLDRFDQNNKDIEKYKNEILNKYSYFKPREYPQKSIGPITTSWGDGPLPYSESEIIDKLEELFSELLSYSGDGFNTAERYTLINTLDDICVAKTEFRDRLVDLLIIKGEFENDLWKSVINSLKKSDISENELIEVFEKIFIQPLIRINSLEFSSVIYSNLKNRDNISDSLADYFFEKIKLLWSHSTNYEYDTINYMDKALNSSKGNIALSMIYLIDISTKNKDKRILENRFKSFLEKMINEETYNDALVVILGNASFFYSIDKKWCEDNILDKYNSDDIKLLNIAWNGFIYQSYLYPEFALIMEPKFHEAIKKINIFEDKGLRKGILKRYISLMVNISTNPINDYVSNIFTKETLDEVIKIFYFELSRYIESLDKTVRNEIFDKWILQFISNRTRSLPVLLTDPEKNLILKLLLEFPDRIDSLNEIFIRLDDSFRVDQDTLNYLFYIIEITKDNSDMINRILLIITNQMKRNTKEMITGYIQTGIRDLYEKIKNNGTDTENLERNMKFLNIN